MQEPTSEHYGRAFFEERADGARQSAGEVVPIIYKLLHPQSVIDIGCGDGIWLHELQRLGVKGIMGVDGQQTLKADLRIPQSMFLACDLATSNPRIERKFEVAMSLEVAEHLPETRAADFVTFLCNLAPVVLFSAAIPFQGGVNHLNEQWPAYWENLFLKEGFLQLDLIRPKIWKNPKIAFWYRQNIFVYASRNRAAELEELHQVRPEPALQKMHAIHEEVISRLDAKLREFDATTNAPGLRQCCYLWGRLPFLTFNAFLRRIGMKK